MNKQAANHGIGERLHQVREYRNISQGQIARAIGVSVGTVQNYEHGRTHITTDRLEQLAQALQCEPVELLAAPGSPLPRYRHHDWHKLIIVIGTVLLALTVVPALPGPPELILDLEQLIDDFERIYADDLA